MITGSTRIAGVIGWPVEHSRSPQMFEAAFTAAGIDAVMIPIGVPPDGLATVVAALRVMRAIGSSVTLPHKLAAAALCDELSVEARAIGAVNCLRFSGERLIGHNTDCHGFTDALVEAGFDPEGKRCVVLGAGGAARAVAYGLRAAKASTVDVFARRPQSVSWTTARPWTTIEQRASFARADLLVDATSIGIAGGGVEIIDALPLDVLRSGAWVSSLVYHRPTLLLERAAQRGYSTIDGRGMLVHQGARAFSIWTGSPPPIQAMHRALAASLTGT